MTHLGVELLLGTSMAVLALVTVVTGSGISPLVVLLHLGARGRPVLVRLRVPPPVLRVVELGTGIALATETGWSLARLRLIVVQHVLGI